MPGRTYRNPLFSGTNEYRYGFNAKQLDKSGEFGSLTHYDYGFRIYNPSIARFLSIDPLTANYPAWSPYPFGMNRPIDGVDLDGKEWDRTTDDLGNTNVSVNTSFSVDANLGLSKEQVSAYQSAISLQLNSTLQTSSGGTFSGSATFNGGDGNGRLVPDIYLYGEKHTGGSNDPMIGGINVNGGASINLYKKDGTLKNPVEVGRDAVHELLHTLRFEHPFEITQGNDTELIHDVGNNYLSTPSTDPNIIYNIMNYSLIYIDGKNAGNTPLNLITKDQIKMMLNEINLQKQGYGVQPKYDINLSDEENEKRFDEFYQNYWLNTPGQEVKQKK